ncbi:MAG: peptide chain release factor N(5)-glutamine methyltransferase [Anaerolineaceae bacterium]
MNAREAAAEVAPRLARAGVADAGFEAEYLVRVAANISRTDYFRGHELCNSASSRLEDVVVRRIRREPSAYIAGEREFYGLAFEVTPDVLVPRPESDLLVQLGLRESNRTSRPVIVDVGTGSGAIAVAIAAEVDAGIVVGVDRSARALAVARRNARRHGARVCFVHGDLLAPLGRVDIVLANLPYIPTAEIAGLEPEVRDWEPRFALDGGADGLTLIRRLIDECAARIRPKLLALEVGLGQAAAVADHCGRNGARAETVRDLAGIERVVCARWA